jgi:microcystin-dependent protein
MADPFVAEIRIFPFYFAPKGWAFCNGQLLPISQNTALFALLGTFYGGDGKSTFALPDLEGRAALQPDVNGPGPGLSSHFLGEQQGDDTVTLLGSEMPVHTHGLRGNALDTADFNTPGPTTSYAQSSGGNVYQANPNTTMAPETLTPQGGDQPHNNLMPYLTMYFNIALQGVFPPRG